MFPPLVARLILKAEEMGYQLTFGEAWRPPETAALYAQQGKGIRNSLHIDKLALDLNLFKDGVYLSKTEDWRPLGEWWEKQNSLCRWGGRFGDGNHVSLEWMGRK